MTENQQYGHGESEISNVVNDRISEMARSDGEAWQKKKIS